MTSFIRAAIFSSCSYWPVHRRYVARRAARARRCSSASCDDLLGLVDVAADVALRGRCRRRRSRPAGPPRRAPSAGRPRSGCRPPGRAERSAAAPAAPPPPPGRGDAASPGRVARPRPTRSGRRIGRVAGMPPAGSRGRAIGAARSRRAAAHARRRHHRCEPADSVGQARRASSDARLRPCRCRSAAAARRRNEHAAQPLEVAAEVLRVAHVDGEAVAPLDRRADRRAADGALDDALDVGDA